MAPFDENAPMPTSTLSGIPTFPARPYASGRLGQLGQLGQSMSGKRVVPRRQARLTSLSIPEYDDVHAHIHVNGDGDVNKDREVGAEGNVRKGVLGETRGGGNIDRSVGNKHRQGEVEETGGVKKMVMGAGGASGRDSDKDISAVYERRLRVLEMGIKMREKKDAEKYDELNAIITDLRAELAIRSRYTFTTSATYPGPAPAPIAPTAPTAALSSSLISNASLAAETPRSTRTHSQTLCTPTRPPLPTALAHTRTLDLSEFGTPSNMHMARMTGSPPVPAVLSRQKRQSMLGASRMADISASVLGTAGGVGAAMEGKGETEDRGSKVEKEKGKGNGREVRRPMSLEEDMSMSEMSFADLAGWGKTVEEDDGEEEQEEEEEEEKEQENEEEQEQEEPTRKCEQSERSTGTIIIPEGQEEERVETDDIAIQAQKLSAKIDQLQKHVQQLQEQGTSAAECIDGLTQRAEAAEADVKALREEVVLNRVEMEKMDKALQDVQRAMLERSSTKPSGHTSMLVLVAIAIAVVLAALRIPVVLA